MWLMVVIIFAGLAALSPNAGLAADVVIGTPCECTGSSISSIASDANQGTRIERSYPFGYGPYSDVVYAGSGSFGATTAYTADDRGIRITFEHARGSSASGRAETSALIWFSPTEDVRFRVSGAFENSDGRTGGVVIAARLLSDELWDIRSPSSSTVFQLSQHTGPSPFNTIEIGRLVPGGANFVDGELDGVLHANLVYRLQLTARSTSAASPAGSSGAFVIAFVPEPSPAMLIALGLAGLARRRALPRSIR